MAYRVEGERREPKRKPSPSRFHHPGFITRFHHPAGLRAVEIWEQADGSLLIIDGGKRLEHGPWIAPPKVRKPIVNNKRYKPGPHQQFSLRPRRSTGLAEGVPSA
jgi:hypothetical protein